MPQRRLFVSHSPLVLQEAFVTALQTLKQADPLSPVVVLVPHLALADRLQQSVLQAMQGLLGVSFHTWSTFAREVTEWSFLRDGQSLLPVFTARRLIQHLLATEMPGNYFAPLARQPGFVRDLLTTLAELKQAGVRPSDIRHFLEQAQLTGTYRKKIDSVYALYDGYERFLHTHLFYDGEDELERAAQLFASPSPSATFFFYGFAEFSPLHRRVIEAMGKEQHSLVFLPWRSGTAYDYATPLLGWLTSLGFQPSTLHAPRAQENNLARLQAGIGEMSPLWSTASSSHPDQSVAILSAPGENREVREIGRAIFHLVRTQGFRFADIAIALPTSEPYGPLLRETFAEWGIPCTALPPRALLDTQAGQTLSLLCQVLLDDFSRARVFEFLSVARPPFNELLGEHALYAQLARWEVFSCRAGIARGAREWRSRLAHLTFTVALNDPDDSRELASADEQQELQAFSLFMDRFLHDCELLGQPHSWQEWAEHTLRVVRIYSSPSPTLEQACALLQRLQHGVTLDETLSLHEWYQALVTALHTTPEASEQDTLDGVFISDLVTVSALPFRAVILPGLIEERFPQTIRQDPVLLDAERQHLSEVLLCDLHQRSQQSEAERLLLARTIQSATEHLLLTYPRLDAIKGRAQVPSSYLLRSIEAMSGRYATLADLELWSATIPLTPLYRGAPQQALDTCEFHLASIEHARTQQNPTSLGYLPILDPFFSHALHSVRQRWEAPHLTSFDGMIEDKTARAMVQRRLFPAEISLTASALEMYARCPFRYFLSTVLGVETQEDPELVLSLQPRERGMLLHDILHSFFLRCQEQYPGPLTRQNREELRALLREVAHAHFATFSQTRTTGLAVVWEVEQAQLLEQLLLLLHWEMAHGQAFLPTAFKVPFGSERLATNETILPAGLVRFALAHGEHIHLRGRIDRIDISPDGQRARILDYKSGKPVRGRFSGGSALQLPLHLYAARQLRSDLQYVTAEYVYINRDEQFHQPAFTDATWTEVEAELRTLVSGLVVGMCDGCFPQMPATCQPCAFPLVCGALAGTRAARKSQDPRLETLRALRNIP